MDLTDDAMLVRGGSIRTVDAVRRKIKAAPQPVLSVWCADALPGEDRAAQLLRICTEADAVYPKVQVGTIGSVRAAGLRVVHEFGDGEPECHYHVVFEPEPSDEQIQGFIDALSEPEPNPTGGKRRRSA
jgi:hypothetical protein